VDIRGCDRIENIGDFENLGKTRNPQALVEISGWKYEYNAKFPQTLRPFVSE
jgi:hypothetical protein